MLGSKKYQLSDGGHELYNETVNYINNKAKYQYLTNPCGEEVLHAKGAYCVIGSLAPYFSESLASIKEEAKLLIRFLIRTNLMDAIYNEEVKRTNRIGEGITGWHELAWKFFNYDFLDLIDENRSQDFWNFIKELRIVCETEANEYSDKLGLNHPHTVTTIKPDGSISKLRALTEGAHLPAHKKYLRWVQIQNSDPLLEKYKKEGYPIKELKSYPNVTAVGFPTEPLIGTLGMSDRLITAYEATPEQQYKWLSLLEKYWFGENKNGQASYTLKLATDLYTLEEFRKIVLENQPNIRCCSILPTMTQEKMKELYEYMPEEEITEEEFQRIVSNIENAKTEHAFDERELLCAGGSCPL